MITDFHTHNLAAKPGTAIVNLPIEALLCPLDFTMKEGGLYSVGIHPWWTEGDLCQLWEGFEYWLKNPQIVVLGECGLDKIKGADLETQEKIFCRQVQKSEEFSLPVTVHCVKAFDRLLALHKLLHPRMKWTVHGFRGKPALASQLLSAGFDLSFGKYYNVESWDLTPPGRRYRETDDDW